ncbi:MULTISPECIES: rod-binding protein [unclassified Sphingomonas]|uniref:rod-binding protein n=1 Tax=unclassified Sphingomonas TaxID=196159 RepID=UPI00285A8B3B|nr:MULTISPECIES: rod-binding protein [unclassified Sphingomonas]MDR6114043.1 flagellar protein FlgJ [Sphingomonas sp. SORGH_AS_0789]MDR6148597.1 flagellar protein FlgJ [Sphingomonas sp. SORGH_AS_0742]
MTQSIAPSSAISPTPISSGAAASAISGSVSTDTRRLSNGANLDKAGTQFEAIFTGMMLKAMRQTKLGDTMFESKALDTFRDMQDQQVAQTMAVQAPLGIGKAVTAFLAKSQPAVNQK